MGHTWEVVWFLAPVGTGQGTTLWEEQGFDQGRQPDTGRVGRVTPGRWQVDTTKTVTPGLGAGCQGQQLPGPRGGLFTTLVTAAQKARSLKKKTWASAGRLHCLPGKEPSPLQPV